MQDYGVDITAFFCEYDSKEYKARSFREMQMGKKIAVWVLLIVAIWYIGIMFFIYSNTFEVPYGRSWLIFIWLIPITFLVCTLLNIKWGNKLFGIIFSSLLCWTLLTAIYLQLLEHNLYLLFISGVPIEMAILLLSYMRIKK